MAEKEMETMERAQEGAEEIAQEGAESKEFAYLTVPRTVGGKDSVRGFMRRSDGQERAEITLPPNVMIPGKPNDYDASFFKLYVNAAQVKAWENDPNNYSIAIPRANKDGEVKQVLLTRDQGHWENPEAEGADRGEWVNEGTAKIRVDVDVLDASLQKAREERQAYVQEHPEHIAEKEKAQAKEVKAAKDKAPSLKEEGAASRNAAKALTDNTDKGAKAQAKAAPAQAPQK